MYFCEVKIHEKYIKRCIELAKNGLGSTYPNPMVGSVIVYKNIIIGEGWHQKAGEDHAEVKAIKSVKDKSILKKATLYVNLEPCNHFGKTPPCSDLIVKHAIPNVVIGCVDPHDKVAGKGIEKLKKNGCKVISSVLEKECIDLNRRFFTFHTKKRPYIILKWAESGDGFIDKIRQKGNPAEPNWITNQYSRQLVHKWRAEEQAILIGTKTAINDNPTLNARHYNGKNPIRIVLDKGLRIPEDYNLLDGSIRTIVFTEIEKNSSIENLIYKQIDFSQNIARQICNYLYEYEVQSLIIEGGAQTLQTFINANLWDEARIFRGDITFHKGIKAPEINGTGIDSQRIHSDVLELIKNTNC